ncbi:hypothetical protein [Cellulomonas sp. WB94]|uniref:hypothetical protein n=1 Tax=Cellulomonas sp. WB94 TaxID=2173174 RepID=UPI0011B21DA3|nr:hypothetical protein [Cellulomonas sp. WB94]
MTPREAIIESVRVREQVALEALGAATGGASLCSTPRAGTPVPAVKYHEGASSALAEARRAIRDVQEGPGAVLEARAVLREIRARWRAQRGTSGRTGPSWAGYLAGGLDALDQLVDDDEGRAHDA